MMSHARRFPGFMAIGFLVISLVHIHAVVSVAADAETKRPNILFIYTDDHSYRTVGCYPDSFDWVRTPAIDRLAQRGMRFDAAYIGTWCMPSRGESAHGTSSVRRRINANGGGLSGSAYDPEQCPFWPSVFRQQGYVTGQIGKWHTGTDTGFGRDWDYQLVWNRPLHTSTAGHYYYDQPITYHGGETKILERYSTDQYSDWAIDFIRGEGRDPDKPWYLWLCYGAVHGPTRPLIGISTICGR
ncbi:MAG: sulfatase-like hydrolase/transferase [Planctomycetaceae bacterium]